MALPHQHLPGQSVHSIRRTVEGIYFLAPSHECREGLAFTYGLAVERSGVMPHVEVTMSNHRQGVFTCLTGKRYRFHEQHHGIFAGQYNGLIDRVGYFWDHRGPTQPILLPGPPDDFFFAHHESKELRRLWRSRWDALGLGTVDRTVLYDLMNPVSANLVQHLRSFPGFKITPEDWGKWSVNQRPSWFDPGYPDASAFMALPPPQWWDRAETVDCGDTRIVVVPDVLRAFERRREWALEERPTGSRRVDPDAFELFISRDNLEKARAYYLDLMDHLEEELRKERARAGKRVLGRRALVGEPTPTPYRPQGQDIVRGNSRYKPRFTGHSEAVAKANAAYAVFWKHYRIAGGRFTARRDFDVIFPAGTVRMADLINVRCRGAPLPDENPMPPLRLTPAP